MAQVMFKYMLNMFNHDYSKSKQSLYVNSSATAISLLHIHVAARAKGKIEEF